MTWFKKLKFKNNLSNNGEKLLKKFNILIKLCVVELLYDQNNGNYLKLFILIILLFL